MKNFIEKYGRWAVITGASSGIGKEFAFKLGEMKFNLLLIARRNDRLIEVKSKLESDNRIQVEILSLDLSSDDYMIKIIEASENKEIGLLINNAGIGSTGNFNEISSEHEEKLVKLNCLAPLKLTHFFTNDMIKRKKGGVIFLGSTAGFQPTPYITTYSASKVFNMFLGDALWYELKKFNIDVLSLCPGGTNTEFQRLSNVKTGPLAAQPEDVVITAIKYLGKKPRVVHGTMNKIATSFLKYLPNRSTITLSALVIEKLLKPKL